MLADRSIAGAIALLTGLALVVACGDDGGGPPREGDAFVEGVYSAVLRAVVPLDGDGDRPVVFVAPLVDGDTIDLEVQVAVVNALEEDAEVRFVDATEEAVDAGDPAAPVRDDGTLVRLGRVEEGTSPVEVEVERYRSAGEVSSTVMEVRRSGRDFTASSTTG